MSALGMERVKAAEWLLEIETELGSEFLEHSLLCGGFLNDVFECVDDPAKAEYFMNHRYRPGKFRTPHRTARGAERMEGLIPSLEWATLCQGGLVIKGSQNQNIDSSLRSE
ncbi:hypothetical protein [Nitrospina watsonii]|uniref:hypothetical protein n=1 Tax=Nitrospina watsonii TaxID=1323948 RepID=UPI0024933B8D|nr:hypothetical protein [Nitrospina watsonii]